MIRKLLIANRGEIACRIIRTCRRMGIGTVAVYSDADVGALHVRSADEAVRIGPAEATHSYLNADNIIAAAIATRADAIHPGYGFLSERVVLPQLCAKHGITWVGPSVDAIQHMGSKIESKRIAEKAGVAGVPGYHGDAQDDDTLAAAAKKIGYPVLIKASAGGGGRGMRRATNEAELRAALPLARGEAQAGFSDPSLLLEKLILEPRHLEVQLAGDKHGALIHLHERECSIQRNYQKVVEEAPAPNLSERTRALLFEAALKLGRAIKYDSLGTVEFILESGEEQPYFLEMNTRLQVEHPVTERVTGLDLVELQIRIAADETLPLTQQQISVRGSAIEVRLNAEDPAAGYRPNIGMVRAADFAAGEGARVDTGISAGSEITPYYDSLLAKIIGFGNDRATAAKNLSRALCETHIFGVGTNQAFLRDIVAHERFLKGVLSTRFIEDVYPKGWVPAHDATMAVAAAALWAMELEKRRTVPAHLGPFLTLGAFRVLGSGARLSLTVTEAGKASPLDVSGSSGNYFITHAGHVHGVTVGFGGRVQIDALSRSYATFIDGATVELAVDGETRRFEVAPAIESAGRGAGDARTGGTNVLAPMPGLINAVETAVGKSVAAGETVVVMEAMKLMIRLPAPVAGRVTEVLCKPGQTVAMGATLVKIEAIPAP